MLQSLRRICTLKVDLSDIRPALEIGVGAAGNLFWFLRFQIELHFEGEELMAWIQWKEKVM
jgi:hypothetical protein